MEDLDEAAREMDAVVQRRNPTEHRQYIKRGAVVPLNILLDIQSSHNHDLIHFLLSLHWKYSCVKDSSDGYRKRVCTALRPQQRRDLPPTFMLHHMSYLSNMQSVLLV